MVANSTFTIGTNTTVGQGNNSAIITFLKKSIWVTFCEWLCSPSVPSWKERCTSCGRKCSFQCQPLSALTWNGLQAVAIKFVFPAEQKSVRWEAPSFKAAPVTWTWSRSKNLPVGFSSLVWLRGCCAWGLHISVGSDGPHGEFHHYSHPHVLVCSLQLKMWIFPRH